MDPITHGIAGALVGKAFFATNGGFKTLLYPTPEQERAQQAVPLRATTEAAKQARAQQAAPLQEPNDESQWGLAPAPPAGQRPAVQNRVAVWAATLGAMFPDADIVAEFFDGRNIAMLELHRGFTHSFVCLPVFALALAGMTRWVAQRRGWAAPSWQKLTLIYATGIALHIFLDLITSFGTMIWSPLSNHRAALDTNFILDFFMTAFVLVPQLAAWTYRERRGPDGSGRGWFTRAIFSWTLLTVSIVGLERLSRAAGFPFSPWAVVIIAALLAAIFFAPARGGWGVGVGRVAWCRAGVAAFVFYLALSGAAQITARGRVQDFARERGLAVEHLAALPLPPSPLRWSGMIRTPDGVWVARFRLTDAAAPEYEFFADSPPNEYIARAKELRSVKTYLWFARFPVARYAERGGMRVVEWSDMRFFSRAGRPSPFAFRVRFDRAGNVVDEGWVED